MLAIVAHYRPKYFLMENVPGILGYRLLGEKIGGSIKHGISQGVRKLICSFMAAMGYEVYYCLVLRTRRLTVTTFYYQISRWFRSHLLSSLWIITGQKTHHRLVDPSWYSSAVVACASIPLYTSTDQEQTRQPTSDSTANPSAPNAAFPSRSTNAPGIRPWRYQRSRAYIVYIYRIVQCLISRSQKAFDWFEFFSSTLAPFFWRPDGNRADPHIVIPETSADRALVKARKDLLRTPTFSATTDRTEHDHDFVGYVLPTKYARKPQNYFQAMMRANNGDTVTYHYTKRFSANVVERYVSCQRSSDLSHRFTLIPPWTRVELSIYPLKPWLTQEVSPSLMQWAHIFSHKYERPSESSVNGAILGEAYISQWFVYLLYNPQARSVKCLRRLKAKLCTDGWTTTVFLLRVSRSCFRLVHAGVRWHCVDAWLSLEKLWLRGWILMVVEAVLSIHGWVCSCHHGSGLNHLFLLHINSKRGF